MTIPRREFLKRVAALAAGGALAGCAAENGADPADSRDGPAGPAATTKAAVPGRPAKWPPSPLPQRPLGATGVSLPILALGGFHLGACADAAAAQELLRVALDEGVRLLDTAESYQDGRSEAWYGQAIEALGVRDEVFLMTKTYAPKERDRASAERHLHGSLERLRTDRLDLWQLHSIQGPEDVDRAFGDDGAIHFLREMKERGVVRFVGVTGHVNPAAHLRALEWYDRGVTFDVVQLPLNALDAHQLSFQKEVLPRLVERGIGVLAMKTAASGALIKEGVCTPAECHRYAWSLPISVAVVGMETPGQVRENARLAREQGPLDADEAADLLARIAPRADLKLEWYKKA